MEATTYRHTGKFRMFPAAIGLVQTAGCAVVLGIVYAYAQYYIPWIYVAALLPFAVGFALGYANLWLIRLSKIRSNAVAIFTVAVASLIMVYVSWAVWAGLVLRSAEFAVSTTDLLIRPLMLFDAMRLLNEVGVWSLSDFEVKGALLALVWVAEAAILICLGIVIPLREFKDLPFCEGCETWCRKTANVARLAHPDATALVSAVKGKDFARLASFESVSLDDHAGSWFEFDLDLCATPGCGQTRVLDVNYVTVKLKKDGEQERKTKKVVENLLLTAEDETAVRALAVTPAAAEPELVPQESFAE